MPLASEHLSANNSLRLLIYGPAKSKKTWYAARAAEFGYRVLLLDFEDGSGIINQLSPEAQARIFILPLADTAKDAYAIQSAITILKGYDFYVNEETRRITQSPQIGSYHININDFGRDTVVVFDSYSALVNSASKRFALDHNLDLSDANKVDWDGYAWSGRLLTWMLSQMNAFPCPMIMIGHETQNVIRKKVLGNAAKQMAAPIETVRRQIVSSSNPHGMSICKYFTDVIYTYAQGRSFKVDTRGSKDEDGGCRHIAPDLYDWDTLTFNVFAQAAHLPKPNIPAPAWHFDKVQDQLVAARPNIIGGSKPAVALTLPNAPVLELNQRKGLVL